MAANHTASDQARPSAVVKWLNGLSDSLAKLGLELPRLPDTDSLIRAAEQITGIRGGDDRKHEAGFRSAVDSALAGGLSAVGKYALRELAVRTLSNRLRVNQLLVEHPEIEQIPVERPVFVVGWYRSGTTLLHRMLAQADEVRIPQAWELYFPAPEGGDLARDQERRKLRMQRMLSRANFLMPGLNEVHPMTADGAEECSALLDNEGLGIQFVHAFGAFRHADWLVANDVTFAYQGMRRQLQLLTWAGGGGRWVLKDPFSLWKIETLLKVFPDAVIVHTQREACEAVPSVCNLSAVLQRCFRRHIDYRELGRFWAEFCLAGQRSFHEFRASLSAGRIVDVDFRSLVENSVRTALVVGQRVGLEISEERLRRTVTSTPGRNRYTLEQFGLEARPLKAQFDEALCPLSIRESVTHATT